MPASVQSTAQRGQHAEDAACAYLQRQGLKVVTRNYRCARGEIDLIMADRNSIVFVEVRYRRSRRFGGGVESVDHHKQRKLIATALRYLQQQPAMTHYAARFDVIAVSPVASGPEQFEMEWIRDAFQVQQQ